MPKRQLKGTVVSDKMEQTVVVEVARIKQHPKYLRRYRVHKKYKAHDVANTYKQGDRVLIEETLPISKDKMWKVVQKLS